MISLDLTRDIVDLTRDLVDIASPSHGEAEIADVVEAALRQLDHLSVERFGHTIVARTDLGRSSRVVLAGHLDTVPANDNWPSRLDDEGVLWGLGSCDMKGGVAAALKVAATLPEPHQDLTFVFYEAEEVEAEHNGLRKLVHARPDLLEADFAILLEPSNAGVEAGCQGTIRVEIATKGVRSHSARWWAGHNAIHDAAEVLQTLVDYTPREVEIDGLVYREGLNAVGIRGGVAGNVIPDECVVTVNYRFAPDLSEADALAHLQTVFAPAALTVTDSAPAAMPGLSRPAAAAFVEAVGGSVGPKFGWTDVAQFTQLGVPAVNFGPGDPSFAHKQDEHVGVHDLYSVEAVLLRWLDPGRS